MMKEVGVTALMALALMNGCSMIENHTTERDSESTTNDLNFNQVNQAKPMEKSIAPNRLPPFKPAKSDKGNGELGGSGWQGPSEE